MKNNTPDEHKFFESNPESSSSDELIDTALRIGELRAEVEKVAGQPVAEGHSAGTPLALQEAFWQHVLDFETAPRMTLDRLLWDRRKFRAVPIHKLDTEEKLHRTLWELIKALASTRYFLHFTDHLSDRELYRLLVDEVLPEKTSIMPDGSEWNTRCHMAEFPTPEFPEPTDCWLAYYADDEIREKWALDFPESPLPAKRDLPFDRDRRLPNPGY